MKFPLLKCLYFVLFLAIFSSTVHANEEKRNFTLVIDAGHGGHDAGAVGSFSKEKNINLNVALAFGRLVEDNCPDVKVIYTRRTDVFIPLQRRADIANNNKAALPGGAAVSAAPTKQTSHILPQISQISQIFRSRFCLLICAHPLSMLKSKCFDHYF